MSGSVSLPVRQEEDLPFVDITSDSYLADPLGTLRAAAGAVPLCRTSRGVEILDHATVFDLLSDSRLHSQDATAYARMGAPATVVEFADQGLLVAMAGDKHRRIRRVFSAGFRVSHVVKQRSSMQDRATDLVCQWHGDTVDFVSEFSSPYPIRVLCDLLGVSATDIPKFTAAATELHRFAAVPLAPQFPAIASALEELSGYVGELITSRRRSPNGDLVSSLVEVADTDSSVTDSELAWNLVNLLFAGQDTTRYQLASIVYELTQRGLWDQLRAHPETIPVAVAEGMRIRPVTQFVVRISDTPVVIHDCEVKPGRRIILNLLAATQDPAKFDNAASLQLSRTVREELAFGRGIHHCLGAALARSEMEAALSVLARRFSAIESAGPPQWTAPASMLHGPETLPLRVSVAEPR